MKNKRCPGCKGYVLTLKNGKYLCSTVGCTFVDRRKGHSWVSSEFERRGAKKDVWGTKY